MLWLAGLAGGAVNGIVGGGTVFTVPALLAAGVPPLATVATNLLAIWPGHGAAAWADRRRIAFAATAPATLLAVMGGVAGAVWVSHVGSTGLSLWIGPLLWLATAIFAFRRALSGWIVRLARRRGPALAVQGLTALYGGAFGAGLGILYYALAPALGAGTDVRALNALKNLLAAAATAGAVAVYAVVGVVAWPQAVSVWLGALAGGFVGARLAGRLPRSLLSALVIAVGLAAGLREMLRSGLIG